MKFNEKLSKGYGDMLQTPTSRVNPVTLNCDIDLETPLLSSVFCTPSRRKEHMGEV